MGTVVPTQSPYKLLNLCPSVLPQDVHRDSLLFRAFKELGITFVVSPGGDQQVSFLQVIGKLNSQP